MPAGGVLARGESALSVMNVTTSLWMATNEPIAQSLGGSELGTVDSTLARSTIQTSVRSGRESRSAASARLRVAVVPGASLAEHEVVTEVQKL